MVRFLLFLILIPASLHAQDWTIEFDAGLNMSSGLRENNPANNIYDVKGSSGSDPKFHVRTFLSSKAFYTAKIGMMFGYQEKSLNTGSILRFKRLEYGLRAVSQIDNFRIGMLYKLNYNLKIDEKIYKYKNTESYPTFKDWTDADEKVTSEYGLTSGFYLQPVWINFSIWFDDRPINNKFYDDHIFEMTTYEWGFSFGF